MKVASLINEKRRLLFFVLSFPAEQQKYGIKPASCLDAFIFASSSKESSLCCHPSVLVICVRKTGDFLLSNNWAVGAVTAREPVLAVGVEIPARTRVLESHDFLSVPKFQAAGRARDSPEVVDVTDVARAKAANFLLT